jgi:CelD/BcsL family acetyltransferase involved in cellulose biosynthesis
MSLGNASLRQGDSFSDGSAARGGNIPRDQAATEEQTLPLLASPPLCGPREEPSKAVSRSGILLSVHDNLDEIEAQWKSFEQRADHTVFQSFEWLAHWQRHIGTARGTTPVIVVGRATDLEILFILQLAIEMKGPFRRLTWLGSRLCDYNAPLLAEHFSARVSAARFTMAWRDVLSMLGRDARFRFDLVDLEKMPESVGEQRNPFMDLHVQAHPSGAYLANLGRSWEDFYAERRSSATRKRERRQLRQLAQRGRIFFVDVEDRQERARTLATLFEQKSRALARMGVEDPFLLPERRAFFLAVADHPAMRELIHVSRLDVGEEIVAASIGLKFRGCYYLILSSYEAGELSRLGPGRAHLHELMRHAIEQGFAAFDFTVGDEPYKRDWSDVELALYDYLAPSTMGGWVFCLLKAQFRRAKRHIKQSPQLWRTFSKARALAGLLGWR